MTAFWNWLVVSSAGGGLSLTLKGAIPFIAIFIGEQLAGELIGGFLEVIVNFIQLVTAGIGLYGLVRKVVNTFKK